MKLNGIHNIINESDINMLDGQKLSDILNSQKDDIDRLKSNVKWLYKYGGVGSGSGGGGSTKTPSLYVTVNGKQITSETNLIIIKNKQLVSIHIGINNAYSSDSYTITYKLSDQQSLKTVVLSAINKFLLDLTVSLSLNSSMSFSMFSPEVNDSIAVNYLVDTYYLIGMLQDVKTDLNIVGLEGQYILFPDLYKEEGIKYHYDYKFYVKGSRIETKYKLDDNSDWEELPSTEQDSGSVDIFVDKDLFDISVGGQTKIGLHVLSIQNTIYIPNSTPETLPIEDITFNIIPDGLFLLLTGALGFTVSPSEGYDYKTKAISFNIIPYYGPINRERDIPLTYSINGSETLEDGSKTEYLKERNIKVITIDEKLRLYIKSGQNTLKIAAILGNDKYEQVYYFNYAPVETNLLWYGTSELREIGISKFRLFFRATDSSSNLKLTSNGSIFKLSQTGREISLDLNNTTPTTGYYDTHIAISLQYSNLNSGTDILTFYSGDVEALTLKADNLVDNLHNNQTASIYIYREPEYNTDVESKFHLIDFYQRCVSSDPITKTQTYELVVYIDGKLEASFGKPIRSTAAYTRVKFAKANFAINLFEVAYIPPVAERTYTFPDSVSTLFYLKYRYLIQYPGENIDNEIRLLLAYNNFTYDLGYIYTEQYDNITALAECMKLPILLFNAKDEIGVSWDKKVSYLLGRSYGQDDEVPTIDVSIKYISSTGSKDINESFTIKPQGSSTKGYRCKNLELAIKQDNVQLDYIRLFSPNFKAPKENYNKVSAEERATFLPEESFTLKADVVDSSHSNNTAVGKFVNEQCAPFGDSINTTDPYSKYIKNCLDGFPVFIVLGINDVETSIVKYYLFGVYNFNLGRNSASNLGYVDYLDYFGTIDRPNPSTVYKSAGENDFLIVEIPAANYKNYKKLVVAEIQLNDHMFDFSQFDESVLFPQTGEKEGNAMFGDFKYGDEGQYKDYIKNFVEAISKAGHYLFFNTLKKNPSELHRWKWKEPKNEVPDGAIQYVRKIGGSINRYEVSNPNIYDGIELDVASVEDVIFISDENPEPALDYRSVVEYYTVCMAFGLVDSVLKNLNIKTWNGKTFKAAFYDMDTCLGINNQGNPTKYLAFSDSWELKYNGNVPENILIYRDYQYDDENKEEESDNFDVSTTYLLAIAKYAKLLFRDSAITFPLQLWAEWRSVNGPLRNAEYFLNTYFNATLNSLPCVIVNFNYRNKYFGGAINPDTGNIDGDTRDDLQKFHGVRYLKTLDWLSHRFHLLDMYFNIPLSEINIDKYNLETGEWEPISELREPKHTISLVAGNSDIIILRDIFSENSTGSLYNLSKINVTVTTPDDTPALITSAGNPIGRFILSGESNIKIDNIYSGAVYFLFGGSENWESLDSINSFTGTTLNIDSNKLDSIKGDNGTLRGITLNTPNLKRIELTSKNYTGDLTILNLNQLINLTEIDLSNSGLGLTIEAIPNLKTISLRNSSALNINITNCEKLTNFDFSKSQITKLSISPYLGSNTINDTNIVELSLSASKADQSITISNNPELTKLLLTDFAYITIKNCAKLSLITISSTTTKCKKLTVLNCGDSNPIFINAGSSGEITYPGGCIKLSSAMMEPEALINLSNTVGIEYAELPSGIKLDTRCFYNSNIRYLKSEKVILKGTNTFENCSNFTLRDSKNGNIVQFGFETTNLANTFKCAQLGSIGIFECQAFINLIPSSVTNISGIFLMHPSIKRESAGTRLDLSKLINLTNSSWAFFLCGVTNWDLDLFTFGQNSSSINVDGMFAPPRNNPVYIEEGFLNNVKDKIKGNFPKSTSVASSDYTITLLTDKSDTKLVSDYIPALKLVTNLLDITFKDRISEEGNIEWDFTGWLNEGWENLEVFTRVCNGMLFLDGFEGFIKLPNLHRIHYSFIDVRNKNIDWGTFFNWDIFTSGNRITSSNYLFQEWTSDSLNPAFALCEKTISYENYSKIITNLNNNKTIVDWFGIFNNCVITVNDPDFTLTLPTNPDVIGMALMYKNAKFTINGSSFMPIRLTDEMLKDFPKCTSYVQMFYNGYFKLVPSLNFFGLVSETLVSVYKNEGDSEQVLIKIYSPIARKVFLSSMFLGATFESKSCDYEVNGDYIYRNGKRIRGRGNLLPTGEVLKEYYIIRNNKYVKNTYSGDPIFEELEDMNITNIGYHNQSEYNFSVSTNNKLFITPDFLYVINSTGDIGNIFADSNLEGLIPKYLLSTCKDIALTNIMRKVNIIPRLALYKLENSKETYNYFFVPENFTNRLDLSYAFNFNIIIPETPTYYKEVNLYILHNSSIPKGATSLAYAFPNNNNYYSSDRTIKYPSPSKLWGIFVNMMGTLNSDRNAITDGLDVSSRKNLKLSNMLPSMYFNSILNGSLFDANFDISSKLTSGDYCMLVQLENLPRIDFNRIIFPKASKNFPNAKFLYNKDSNLVKIPQGLIKDGSSSKQYYNNTYSNGNITVE